MTGSRRRSGDPSSHRLPRAQNHLYSVDRDRRTRVLQLRGVYTVSMHTIYLDDPLSSRCPEGSGRSGGIHAPHKVCPNVRRTRGSRTPFQVRKAAEIGDRLWGGSGDLVPEADPLPRSTSLRCGPGTSNHSPMRHKVDMLLGSGLGLIVLSLQGLSQIALAHRFDFGQGVTALVIGLCLLALAGGVGVTIFGWRAIRRQRRRAFKEDLRSWINLDPRDGDPEVDPRARPVDLQQ